LQRVLRPNSRLGLVDTRHAYPERGRVVVVAGQIGVAKRDRTSDNMTMRRTFAARVTERSAPGDHDDASPFRIRVAGVD
jgi:hypothetical protein